MHKIHKLEERILDLKDQLSADAADGPVMFRQEREKLESELDKLEARRQFLLDRREGLGWKLLWNIIVPIGVSIITTYITLKLIK